MEKLINKQKLSFEININNIPISKNLNDYLKKNKKIKKILYLMVMIINCYLHHQKKTEN